MPEILDGAIRRAVVIGNGFAGAENQCIGLVRALGFSNRHTIYRVTRPRGGINRWLQWLPVSIHKKLESVVRMTCDKSSLRTPHTIGLSNVLEADALHLATMARKTFHKDGPLLVVASGRGTISVASSIKRLAPENVFLVQIQHPRFHLNRFDLVITPRHDYYPLTPHAQQQIPWFLRRWVTPWEPPGRNVVLTVGALHQADCAALRVAASAWHKELGILPKPLLVVNVGGPTGNCPYGVDLVKKLVVMLQSVMWSCGSIRISFSRRTPDKFWLQTMSSLLVVHLFDLVLAMACINDVAWGKILVKEFSTNPKVQIWDGEGPNPHMGHLAWADAFVITADSVSMLSEACSTGKPVYVVGAELCTWKFADFQNSLQKHGVARPFTGKENVSCHLC
ncbi:Mitochondrial fission protein [Vigna angularis]|uniref:Mitochondrial fission protein n=1 Tax=Phaseolus angularis TaxID=3914 RepID=A0A8T0L3R3_PHAAN|nr:Mitochondrial fission protein [Vigna angularis]